jgi:membrane-anchored glycerophosphoryl diester phosphodiesterase (GDPDase)
MQYLATKLLPDFWEQHWLALVVSITNVVYITPASQPLTLSPKKTAESLYGHARAQKIRKIPQVTAKSPAVKRSEQASELR